MHRNQRRSGDAAPGRRARRSHRTASRDADGVPHPRLHPEHRLVGAAADPQSDGGYLRIAERARAAARAPLIQGATNMKTWPTSVATCAMLTKAAAVMPP